MSKKFRFKRFDRYAEPTMENMEKLNSIRSLYYAYLESDFQVEHIAEFYESAGQVLMGKSLDDLELKYIVFENPGRTEKELILSTSLLKSQINDLLNSNMKDESKEGVHNLLGTLLDYSEDDVKEIRLFPGFEEGDDVWSK